MRGAVLSALGLRVQEHVMRRHYGMVLQQPFKITDPIELHDISLDGTHVCMNKFYWYSKMVQIVPQSLSCFRMNAFRMVMPLSILCTAYSPSLNGTRRIAGPTPLTCGFQKQLKLRSTIGTFQVCISKNEFSDRV